MELIDKDAVVAEIDRRIKTIILLLQKPEMSDSQEELQSNSDCLKSIRGYILNTLEVKEVDAIKWGTDIPQGDLIVAKVKEDFCDKKDCYEVLHFASKPYPHYYDAWGEEVPYSAIEKWCLI